MKHFHHVPNSHSTSPNNFTIHSYYVLVSLQWEILSLNRRRKELRHWRRRKIYVPVKIATFLKMLCWKAIERQILWLLLQGCFIAWPLWNLRRYWFGLIREIMNSCFTYILNISTLTQNHWYFGYRHPAYFQGSVRFEFSKLSRLWTIIFNCNNSLFPLASRRPKYIIRLLDDSNGSSWMSFCAPNPNLQHVLSW